MTLPMHPPVAAIRRWLLPVVATLATGVMALPAGAQATSGAAASSGWPSKPIRLIVPFPPGGGTDTIAREASQRVTRATGWTFVIDNRPGAGGNLGVDAVAKSAPDGYTLVIGQTSNIAINPTLYAKLPYDPVKDLAPVVLLATAPLVIVTGAATPYKTLADVVSAAKAKPGDLNFASPGNGTVAHLTGELFQKAAGIKAQHVPYKGSSQAMVDVISGTVEVYLSSVPTLIGMIKQGKIRPLAVSSSKRVDDIPEVPTINELGYPGFNAVTWFGLLAPSGTPKDIIARINAEFNKALKQPDLSKRLSDEGADIAGGSPEHFGNLIRDDLPRWGRVVRESGAKLD